MVTRSSIHVPFVGDGQYHNTATVLVNKEGTEYEIPIFVLGDPNNADSMVGITNNRLDTRYLSSVTDSIAISGEVTTSGSVSITSMPAITGTVAISTIPSITGTVAVSTMPSITGTVGVSSLPAIGITNTSFNVTNLTGTPFYNAGTSGGTVTLTGGKKLLGVTAYAKGADGTMTINGGDTITIRSGLTLSFSPLGNYVNPTIVFSAAIDYIVDGVS